jgi:vancomycin resistance protein YoaR
LLAHGVSTFGGSPNNRRHNIAVGLEKFKGLIVPPGAAFSFDDNLGPVTAEAGFLPELVIKGSEGTIPELGGGLCQVSTTTFRAAMAAGLPITARRNHAYAVQYYAPQGTDATIYPGSADLKFVNDTPGAILIWSYLQDRNTLVFDFWGTKDDRQVTLHKPVQFDRKTDGSLKATWTRDVTKNGVTTTDVFKSTYQPPALFHKTEAFVGGPTTTPINTVPKLQ